jgi:hypothetical protein
MGILLGDDLFINMIEVKDCIIGTYQAAFKEEDVISRTDISELFL